MELPSGDDGGLSLTAFERTARQIAEEERRLRQMAEERLREFVRLALDFASVFLADELDARTRTDPYFLNRATATDWRSLLQAAQQRQLAQASRWPAAQPGDADRWRIEALQLREEVQRLQGELAMLAGKYTVCTERLAASSDRDALAAEDRHLAAAAPTEQQVPPTTSQAPASAESGQGGSGLPPLTKPKPPVVAPAAQGTDVHLPPMPALAPGRFADQLRNWPRESLALVALGVTGWSMRFAIAELMSAKLGDVQPNAGSLRRVFANLARRGFWIEDKVVVNGVHRTEEADQRTPGMQTTLILVRLTELGRDVLRACGVQPVSSEWDRLLAAHGGSAQTAHAGLVCTFTYHARRRGYATTVCPEVIGPAAPDAHVSRNDESLYVEVEDESGSSERRMRKWRNQAALQGRAALVAVTPAARTNLVNEACAAGVEHGVASDLQTLIETQEIGGPLWVVEW